MGKQGPAGTSRPSVSGLTVTSVIMGNTVRTKVSCPVHGYFNEDTERYEWWVDTMAAFAHAMKEKANSEHLAQYQH